MSDADKATFLSAFQDSVTAQSFVRLTLGKYRGAGDVQKAVVTPVIIKGQPRLKIVTSHARKDITENGTLEEVRAKLDALLGGDYLSATLFATTGDLMLQFTKKKATTLARAKPTFTELPAATHNRAKSYAVDPARPYLKDLGISDAHGVVKPSMYGKFKQICAFVEIVDQLISDSALAEKAALSVVDIGSGKGYLTFALHDHLTAKLGKRAAVTGVELRAELVALCSGIAQRHSCEGLAFDARPAGQGNSAPLDMLIALHACDTATDDAIFNGITAGAEVIVTAPCCQHEIAPQLGHGDAALEGLLKFGLFKQRQADLVTDAARCLLLEAEGFKVKVIEFVSTEHTGKNILIAAIRSESVNRERARRQYVALKALAGFDHHHLEALLQSRTEPAR